jgi:hypothetical protein
MDPAKIDDSIARALVLINALIRFSPAVISLGAVGVAISMITRLRRLVAAEARHARFFQPQPPPVIDHYSNDGSLYGEPYIV